MTLVGDESLPPTLDEAAFKHLITSMQKSRSMLKSSLFVLFIKNTCIPKVSLPITTAMKKALAMFERGPIGQFTGFGLLLDLSRSGFRKIGNVSSMVG